MATIERRQYRDKATGKTVFRYKAKIRLRAFPYEEATFDRKTDADAWAAKREYELQHQQHFGAQAYKTKTLGDLLARYEDTLKVTNPRRYKASLPVIKVWKQRIGHIKLCNLSKDIIISERDRLKNLRVKDDSEREIVSNATVNRKMAVIRRAINVAIGEWGWMTHNPANVKALPEPKGRTRFLQGEELDNLLSACRDSDNKYLLAIVVLAVTTGARRGEIRNIRVKDVDFVSGRIVLPTSKNGKPRSLFLTGYALDLVKGIHAKTQPKQVYLFPSPHDITCSNDFRTAWRTTIKRSGIEDFKFHDLRHSAASFYALNGAGLHQIAEILGHTSFHVTKRYTHLLETETAKVVESTAAKVFGHDKTGLG
jgi:integrase